MQMRAENKQGPKSTSRDTLIVIFRASVLAICAVSLMLSQEALTNDSIIKMVKAGLSEAVLLSMVNSQPGNYSIGVEDLVGLKTAGVSERVIAAMAAKSAGNSETRQTSLLAPGNSLMPQDIGAYVVDGEKLRPLAAEVVSLGSTSPFRVMATGGFGAVKLKGKLAGAKSPVQLSSRIMLILRCPEGVDPDSYQLVSAEVRKDTREFTTSKATFFGGVSNGPDKKGVQSATFEKTGPNTYRASLEGLKPGEYVIYGQWNQAGAMAGPMQGSIGKMYTFGVVR